MHPAGMESTAHLDRSESTGSTRGGTCISTSGAEGVAAELTSTFADAISTTIVTEDEGLAALLRLERAERLYFLLYLNNETFLGEAGKALASQCRLMIKHDKSAIVLIHEQDGASRDASFHLLLC